MNPLILVILIIFIATLTVVVLYLLTLQKTINLTNPKNRSINPNEVWQSLIPFIGVFLHIGHIKRIEETLKSDFNEKGIKYYNESQFGALNGYQFCILIILNYAINIFLFYQKYKYQSTNEYNQELTYYLQSENTTIIYFILGITSLLSFIIWVIYWVKISNCKNLLLIYNTQSHNLNSSFFYHSVVNTKQCTNCNFFALAEDNFCMKCGSSEFQINSINSKQRDEIIIDDNEKECPNCNVIINKNHLKCEFCDYDFELKQVNIVNKDSYSDGKSRKKIFIFTVIMLFILFVTWFIGYYNQNKNIDNNEIVNEAEIDEKPLNSSTQTEEVNINQSTCANCGNLFTGFGYMMISEGNCVPCTEENSVDCEFCSEACGIENDKKSLEQYNKILNENGYNSLNENEENDYQSNTNCSFNSGGDVLTYLIGKTFRQKGGSISIRFNTDGAIISGSEQYQWITYKSLGGQKGYVKLASINPSHPDGTIQLWVSCRDNAVTDGETVLLYD